MAKNEVEGCIARITQMARAPASTASWPPSGQASMSSPVSSRPTSLPVSPFKSLPGRFTILDAMGADKLLGKGDMLFSSRHIQLRRDRAALSPTRKSTASSRSSISRPSLVTTRRWNANSKAQAPTEPTRQQHRRRRGDHPKVHRCHRVEEKASSLMQRRLRSHLAARIMDELEDRGLVGPSRGAEPREILSTSTVRSLPSVAQAHPGHTNQFLELGRVAAPVVVRVNRLRLNFPNTASAARRGHRVAGSCRQKPRRFS